MLAVYDSWSAGSENPDLGHPPVPAHGALRIGTLNAILAAIAAHKGVTKMAQGRIDFGPPKTLLYSSGLSAEYLPRVGGYS